MKNNGNKQIIEYRLKNRLGRYSNVERAYYEVQYRDTNTGWIDVLCWLEFAASFLGFSVAIVGFFGGY